MSSIFDKLLAALPANTALQDIRIGAFWTAVVVETAGQRRCGLAASLRGFSHHHHSGGPAVKEAGHLLDHSPLALAGLVQSPSLMEASVGMAAVNALLPVREEWWVEINAEQVIARHGAGKRVAVVGHFPFINRLKDTVGQLWVLEQEPQGDDLPAEAAPEILPQADIVAITGTSLTNHTFDSLMALRQPNALVLLLGPSTPLSPVMFEQGVHLLSGAVVADIPAALRAVSQGANFKQLHRQGVRLVTMQHPRTSLL
jgi:hypothetical protein